MSILIMFVVWFSFISLGGHLEELDPLPNEDISVTDENVSHNSQNNEFITISVTNEDGQNVKQTERNGYVEYNLLMDFVFIVNDQSGFWLECSEEKISIIVLIVSN